MLIQKNPPLHLSYCLNIHPGETLPEVVHAIQHYATAVRQALAWPGEFGLGLRLSCQAAQELSAPGRLAEFHATLQASGMYAFSINGFPYGQFHGVRVKEKVYEPDWRSPLRRDYTCQLASILATLAPKAAGGSISTVPLGYRAAWPEGSESPAIQRLMETVVHLHHLGETTGCLVHAGLEPEPDCVLETTEETISFLHRAFREGPRWLRGQVPAGAEEAIIRKHLGVCLDTCHVALQFEDPAAMLRRYVAEGILVSKIQVSAALEVDARHAEEIKPFDEPVYMHQVKALDAQGRKQSWRDLPDALADWPAAAQKIRVHFHVPLFWDGTPGIKPTSGCLGPEFWAAVVAAGATRHLEVETYSFGMMPAAVRPPDIVQSLKLELGWVMARL